jgi:hypothetical protein
MLFACHCFVFTVVCCCFCLLFVVVVVIIVVVVVAVVVVAEPASDTLSPFLLKIRILSLFRFPRKTLSQFFRFGLCQW